MTDTRPPSPAEEQRLRALLEDSVADVDPSPALTRIRARTGRERGTHGRPLRRWAPVALGAAAATAAVVAGVAMLANGPGGPPGGPAGTPPASAPVAPTVERAVPVYYLGDTPAGPRLFREFHRLRVADDASAFAKAALVEALSASSLDPDYRSPWADLGAGLREVDRRDGVILVDLEGPPELTEPRDGLSVEEARIAVQQLVHTAQAAYGERAPVLFRLDGTPATSLLGVDVSTPVEAADPLQVQATVWVTSPQEGDTVAGTFTVAGRGAFFEATVSWELRQGDRVVRRGYATADEGMTLSPYSFTVEDVPPGSYLLRVFEADVSAGEGPGEPEDTKQLTVSP